MEEETELQCREAQNSELELLRSMYSADELQFSHPLDYEISMEPEFQIKIKLDEDKGKNEEIEVTFQLPSTYPWLVHPSVFIRVASLTNSNATIINHELRSYLDKEIELGEPCVMQIIMWIQEHVPKVLQSQNLSKTLQAPSTSDNSTDRQKTKFTRLWIYSHHIYSKFKRRDLLSLGGQLNLTGFTLPGKPGIVCVEGGDRECVEFWEGIRSWTWKKINVIQREEKDISTQDIEKHRRFQGLEEMSFLPSKQGAGREYHMDMNLFKTFLNEHNSGYMFQMFFGLE